ncbi:MAG: hypothetical protein K6U74_10945 [Firmicutes bacterium]|nr:hypothetical protein [Bacillota bacterium]
MCALPESKAEGNHVLLTSLGPKAQSAVYFLHGKTAGAKQSPLALLQVLPPERLPQEIIVLRTERLRE